MIGLKRGTVKIIPYDKTWPIEFNREKEKLEKLLGPNVISIEHVGSTSIHNLGAKPIIDVLIGVKSIKKEGKICSNILDKKSGYYKRFKYSPKVRFLIAKGNEEKRTHYIHIVRYKGRIWDRSILFRDYLRKNKLAIKKYFKLKKLLANKYNDNREKYTKEKSAFIKSSLLKAKNIKQI